MKSRSDSDASRNNGAQGPVSRIEQIIAAAWAEVLSVPSVDPHTNFFALGGHSLLAIQCLSKLRGKLPVVLSINDFFENSTVFEQAELVGSGCAPVSAPTTLRLTLSPRGIGSRAFSNSLFPPPRKRRFRGETPRCPIRSARPSSAFGSWSS